MREPPIKVLFWDVGGVLLEKGWPTEARQEAARRFSLDAGFEARHQQVVADFECGRLSLDEYLDRTVFDRPRPLSREAFKGFMFSWSRPRPEALALVSELARGGRYLMATLNNESHELNQFRIDRFGLRSHFAVFLSSCVLGCRKPDPRIYAQALEITQRRPEECAFLDDQPENVEAARAGGMAAIRYEDAPQARRALRGLGVEASG
ncbi:MAG TPA: HAD family phosphatase [Vicinamibacteria bacterium]|jgi:putative hydrolase of the HAD superfamily|nr:HAD family phosphatase [Vicinamibacteria bacterium]